MCLPLQAALWLANPGDNLQVTLNEISPGDTLLIAQGEYHGSLVLEKPVTIIGNDYPVINGEESGNVILIIASGVHLQGLDIRWSGTRLLEDEAGIKIEGDNATVEQCRIIDTLHGIYVKGGKRVTIRGNYIRGRTDFTEPLRGNGIHLWNTDHNLIENNEIEQARDGIYFSFADETKVINNHVHHLRYGLHYMYSDDNIFTYNLFENNVAGAALMYSKKIHFEGNAFIHNRGFRAYGVLYQSCDYCTSTGNLIFDNTKGLHFDASNYNRNWHNDVVGNDIAVQINASCEENILFENNFIDNLSGLVVDAKGYPNHWSERGKGNYWSNYSGYDFDNDNIGDEPHKLQSVFEYLEGEHPEVRLYLFSPAAQVLETAENVLPILRASAKEDPFPLMQPVDPGHDAWNLLPETHHGASIPMLLIFGFITFSPIIIIVWKQK